MSDWLVVVLLGIIEGITEFLPISSTGHLLLAEHLLGTHKSDLFNVVIQAAAVLAVIPLFPERVGGLLLRWREPAVRDYWLKLAAAFVLTGVGGVILEKNDFELPDQPLPIGLALLTGGLLFLVVERWIRDRPRTVEITWTIALAIGAAQLVAAVFPGASRSGTTIILALMLGLSRPAATEFTFLVGIPTMLAASGLKIAKAVFKPVAGAPPEDWGQLAVAFLVSGVVSFVVVKWLLGYVRTHTFRVFGWYRIALGVVILLLVR